MILNVKVLVGVFNKEKGPCWQNFVASFTCLDLECERDLGEGDWLCPLEPDLAREGDALFLDLPPCIATPRPPVEPAGEVLSDMLVEVLPALVWICCVVKLPAMAMCHVQMWNTARWRLLLNQ